MDGYFFEEGLFGEDISELGKEESEKIREEANALGKKIRSVFSTPDGKEVADFIIKGLCGCTRPAFNPNALIMARDAGKHAVGFFLKEILEEANE